MNNMQLDSLFYYMFLAEHRLYQSDQIYLW